MAGISCRLSAVGFQLKEKYREVGTGAESKTFPMLAAWFEIQGCDFLNPAHTTESQVT
jgi:hypothetical protein